MIIPKKKVCDICGATIHEDSKSYKIKFRDTHYGFFRKEIERGHDDMCSDCMSEFIIWLRRKKKNEN